MDKPKVLNLGGGLDHIEGMVNVDLYGDPDIRHDLNLKPYPFGDNSIDAIYAKHVFEHLHNWWGAFEECSRILKPGGRLEIRVPDESNGEALTFRDHLRVFGINSFHGRIGARHGTNAWAQLETNMVPLKLTEYHRVPFPKYAWMVRWPFHGLLAFCADHLRNFIHEQHFVFVKV